jgi:hypothetical protein
LVVDLGFAAICDLCSSTSLKTTHAHRDCTRFLRISYLALNNLADPTNFGTIVGISVASSFSEY